MLMRAAGRLRLRAVLKGWRTPSPWKLGTGATMIFSALLGILTMVARANLRETQGRGYDHAHVVSMLHYCIWARSDPTLYNYAAWHPCEGLPE